jgi:hypothetical protein
MGTISFAWVLKNQFHIKNHQKWKQQLPDELSFHSLLLQVVFPGHSFDLPENVTLQDDIIILAWLLTIFDSIID